MIGFPLRVLFGGSLCLLALPAQSGRTMVLTAPAVLGQTAGFAMRHPAAAAGNVYAIMLAAPTSPQAVPVSFPGVVVNGLLRLQQSAVLVGTIGLLDATGRSPVHTMGLPNDPLLVGFSFDVQGAEIDGAGVVTLSDDDLELTIAAPPSASLAMVAIAPGTFAMGSNAPSGPPYFGRAAERPVHQVTISRPFWMAKYEVTQASFQAVMGTNPSTFPGANLPVETVSWIAANAYCAALSATEAAAGRLPTGYVYRLPTEAEWEYCCRAGTTTEFAYGPTLVCGQAQFQFSHHSNAFCPTLNTIAVGSFAPNAWGLHDMTGNVYEWCLDQWGAYPAGPVTDPYVATGTVGLIIRGGSWSFDSQDCRSAYRDWYSPGVGEVDIGFRVVCAPAVP